MSPHPIHDKSKLESVLLQLICQSEKKSVAIFHFKMYQQFFQNIRPPTLLDASLYNLIQNKSWVINNIGQVWNHLPPSVKKLFLDEAFKHLDNKRDISLLLKIFLMSVQSGEPQCLRSIKTPKYIESSDTETRQDLLKILLDSNKFLLERVKRPRGEISQGNTLHK